MVKIRKSSIQMSNIFSWIEKKTEKTFFWIILYGAIIASCFTSLGNNIYILRCFLLLTGPCIFIIHLVKKQKDTQYTRQTTNVLDRIEKKLETNFYRIIVYVIASTPIIIGFLNNTKLPKYLILLWGLPVLILYFLQKYKITRYINIVSHVMLIFLTGLYMFFILNPTHP